MPESESKNKRVRIPISCSICRRRKVKCDRLKPHCSNCIRHNQADLCTYIEKEETIKKRNQQAQTPTDTLEEPSPKKQRPDIFNSDFGYKFPQLEKNKPVYSEIKLLKDKIKQIESSISMADMSQQNANISVERQFSSPPSVTNLSKHKLPPIQSFSPTPFLPIPSPSQFTPSNKYSNYSYTRYSTITDTPNSFDKQNDFEFLYNSIQIDLNTKIDFFSGVPIMMYRYSRIHSYGPLSLLSSILNDKFTGPVRDQVMKFKKKYIFNNLDPQKFKKMIIHTSGIKDIEPVTTERDVMGEEKLYEVRPFNQVIAQVIDVLPPPKVLWMLIERFFRYVYPFSPYLDQKSFQKDVQRLTNTFPDSVSDVKITELTLARKLDLSIIGSLLLVLKLSYLTLSGNLETSLDFPPKSKEELYLLTKELNPNLIDVAQSCLSQFNLIGRCALPIFQCALLMYEYKKIDSFDGFADGEAHIYINMLVNIAVSIGLNRDPEKFDPVVGDSPLGNLWRKIWYGLVASEHVQFSESGASKGIIEGSYNTELPFFKIETSNIEDYQLEKKVIEMMRGRYKLHCSIDELSNECINLNVKPSIECLLGKLFTIEANLFKKYGTLKDLILRSHDDIFVNKIEKLYSIVDYLQAISIMKPIYFRILQSLDEQQNIVACKFFTFKINSIFMYVLFNFHELGCHSYRYIGTGFDSVITPALEVVIHKAWFVLIELCCKTLIAREILDEMTPTDEIRSKLNEMKSFRERLAEFTDKYYLPALTIISSKYYYAWRILKTHKFIIQLLKDRQIKYTEERKYFNIVKYLSCDDLIKLNELITIHNYNIKSEPSKFGREMLERLRENISDEDPRFTPLKFSTFPDEPMSFNTPFESAINETNPSPSDDFWFGMYNKSGKKSNVHDPLAEPLQRFDLNDIAAEYGLSLEYKNGIPSTPSNVVSKDEFVDQTIYDMFN